MNTFATLKLVITFKQVTYYTVQFEGEARTLWEQFLDSHEDEQYDDDLNILRSAMWRIGNESGAQARFFRFEAIRGGDASALPPPTRFLEGEETNLRLYCLRFSNSLVILFSGAIKTAPTASECNQVRPHFLLANRLSKAIHEAILAKQLKEDTPGKLLFEEDFELNLL